MKKIISISVIAFLFSQSCFAQQATLLENSEHKSNGNMNTYLGKDENHIYYQYLATGSVCMIASDHKGNCIQSKEIWDGFAAVKDIRMPYFLQYISFNGKFYLLYGLVEKTQKESVIQKDYVKSVTHIVCAVEYPVTGNYDLSKAIILYKGIKDEKKDYTYFGNNPLVYISEDSSKLAVICLNHLTVLNQNFEKVSESDIKLPSIPSNKVWGLNKSVFTGEKLLFFINEHSKAGVVDEVTHDKIWAYNIEDQQSKIIDLSSEKNLYFPAERIVWKFYDSNGNAYYKYVPSDNYRYNNGVLFMFGSLMGEKDEKYLTGLFYLKIDIENATYKIKYISAGGGEKYEFNRMNTAGIKFCNDESVMVYNNYFLTPNDTLECIKFDKEMNIIWRKKTPTVVPQDRYENAGYCFVNNKLGFIYAKTSNGDMKNLIKVDFDEESGETIEETIYQYNQKVYEPHFVSFEAIDANNLFLEMQEKNTAKFLKIPF